jgi:hypothetical protein
LTQFFIHFVFVVRQRRCLRSGPALATALPTTATHGGLPRLPSRLEFFIEAKRQGRQHGYVDLDFSGSAAP